MYLTSIPTSLSPSLTKFRFPNRESDAIRSPMICVLSSVQLRPLRLRVTLRSPKSSSCSSPDPDSTPALLAGEFEFDFEEFSPPGQMIRVSPHSRPPQSSRQLWSISSAFPGDPRSSSPSSFVVGIASRPFEVTLAGWSESELEG